MTATISSSYIVSPVSITVGTATEAQVIPPDVSITVQQFDKQADYIVSFVFNQPITNFELTDIDVSNCSVSDLTGEGDIWTATLTLEEDTAQSGYVELTQNSVQNEDGTQGPQEAVRINFNYDTTITAIDLGTCRQKYHFANRSETGSDPNVPPGPFPYSYFEDQGGSFEGVLEAVTYGRTLFAVVQIGRRSIFSDGHYRVFPPQYTTVLNTYTQASAVLIRYDLDTCTVTTLKKYPFVSVAARSLKIVDSTLYFFEGSHYAYYKEGEFYEIENGDNPPDEEIITVASQAERITPFISIVNRDEVESEWRLSGPYEIEIGFHNEDAEYKNIKDSIRPGRIFFIGRKRVIVISRDVDVYGTVSIITIRYRDDDFETPLPAVGSTNDLKISLIDKRKVFSRDRLQPITNLPENTSIPHWKSIIGHLYKLNPITNAITDLGFNWISSEIDENPNSNKPRPWYEVATLGEEEQPIDRFYGIHGGTASPIISDGEKIHLITGYGKLDNLYDPENEVSRIDNWQWIQYHNKLNQVITKVETNGKTVLRYIEEISTITNSIIYFDGDTFVIRPRNNIRGELDTNVSAIETTEIELTNTTRDSLPTSGLMLIDDELIKYASTSGETISTLTRGDEGTSAAAHNQGAQANYVDHILDLNADVIHQPISTINIQNETKQLYNRVKINYGGGKEYEIDDPTSISIYGDRQLSISVSLDETQLIWVKHLAQELLSQFKNLRQIITMRLAPTIYMKLGDSVLLKCSERDKLNRLTQLVDVQQSFKRESSGGMSMETIAKFLTL